VQRRAASTTRSVARSRREGAVCTAEHGVEASQWHAVDAVRNDLRVVLVARPVVRLGPAGEVADRATTVSSDQEAERAAGR